VVALHSQLCQVCLSVPTLFYLTSMLTIEEVIGAKNLRRPPHSSRSPVTILICSYGCFAHRHPIPKSHPTFQLPSLPQDLFNISIKLASLQQRAMLQIAFPALLKPRASIPQRKSILAPNWEALHQETPNGQ